MSSIVIKAENLGKKYTIGHQAENGRYVALRDVLMHNARTLWNKTKDLAKGKAVIQGDTLYIKNPEPHHGTIRGACNHQRPGSQPPGGRHRFSS